jgi:hypothetical protein
VQSASGYADYLAAFKKGAVVRTPGRRAARRCACASGAIYTAGCPQVDAARAKLFNSSLDTVLKTNARAGVSHVVSARPGVPSFNFRSTSRFPLALCQFQLPINESVPTRPVYFQAVVNKFADRNVSEFRRLLGARNKRNSGRRALAGFPNADTVPDGEPVRAGPGPRRQVLADEVIADWTTSLPNVRNQGDCGSW